VEKGIIFSSLVKTMCVLCFSVIGDYNGTHRRRLQKMLGNINRFLRSQRLTRGARNVTTRREFGIMTMLTFRLIKTNCSLVLS